MLKKILLAVLLLVLAVIGYQFFTLYPSFPIGTGYAAKKMCTCHFVAGRTQESIAKDDLGNPPLNLAKTTIDEENKSVTASIFGMAKATAVYRENLGCVLLQGKDDYNIQLDLPKVAVNDTLEFPFGEKITIAKVTGVDYEAVQKAVDNVFDPSLDMDIIKTRAVVVVYKDTLIAEKYANGFDKGTEILGWSMNKSIVSALLGILAKDGKVTKDQKQLFEHWTDDRADITVHDMLQMQSGLAFDENYDEKSDATKMLFMSEDIVKSANQKALAHPIGTHWSYSSGTSNMLSGFIRNQFENHEDYLKFPHERLFRPIGMNSMVFEIDESGNYIGSSYGYATPRDWAKFGMLYLNEGNWFGNQIIDSSWVAYTQEDAEHSNGLYGGHFWQNDNHSTFPDAPADLYYCSGFEGQNVYIIPSRDVVIVRMGLNEGPEYDGNGLIRDILKALDN